MQKLKKSLNIRKHVGKLAFIILVRIRVLGKSNPCPSFRRTIFDPGPVRVLGIFGPVRSGPCPAVRIRLSVSVF